MNHHQLTPEERYMLATLRRQGRNQSEIARSLGRHRSTACREVRRNSSFTAEDFALIDELLCQQLRTEQVAGYLRRQGLLSISHETIYCHVWRNKRAGGTLYTHLRGTRKRRRKRYGTYDSRGRLAGKQMISERPPEVEARAVVGHWEADTMMGAGTKDFVVTLVERKTGLVLVGKLSIDLIKLAGRA